jgi:hypothetical protein
MEFGNNPRGIQPALDLLLLTISRTHYSALFIPHFPAYSSNATFTTFPSRKKT